MAAPPIRILLVDDDAVDRMACRRAFARDPDRDIELLEAETGEAGLRLAQSSQPDCILLDYRLPDQTGREFLAALAAGGEIAIPIIALTGEDSAEVAVEMMRSGARDYLCKDAERRYLQALPAAIERVLQGQRIIEGRRQAEQALRESRETLRRLTAHREDIKESERKRIAQEIHDELGSLLTGIKAYVSVSIERGAQAGRPADPLLVEAARLSEEAIQAVRRVINDLRPSVLDQLGVWEAIAWYAGQLDGRADLACDCVIAPSAAAVQLDPARSTMLFRIVQESLTNVVRHAQASLVSVHASAEGGVVSVEIKDDGRGFAAGSASDRQSWGLQGMYERARHFGGRLTIISVPGGGTRVALQLPLETDDGR